MNLQKSRVITFVTRMEKSEFYDFGKYIRCHYNNQRQQVVLFFDYLKKYYPDFEHPKFSKEMAFKKLYPKQKFNAKKVNNVMYSFGELIDEYLILQELKRSKRVRNILYLEALQRKTLSHYFYKHIENWKNELLALPLKTPEVYFDLQHISKQQFFYINTDKRNLAETSFEEMLKYSDEYFAIEKLRNALYTNIRNKSLNKNISIKMLDIATDYLHKHPLDNPVVQVYKKMISLNVVPDFKTFLETKTLIFEHIDDLPTMNEKLDWAAFLVNYIVFQKSKGKIEYNSVYFEVLNWGIEKGYFHEKGILNASVYANVVIYASSAKKVDWLESFITQRFAELSKEDQENFKALSQALLEYAKENLEGVILLFNDLEIPDFAINLLVRSLKIRCYFELEMAKGNYYEALIYSLDAHEKYIRRHNEIPERRRNSNINFVKLAKEVIKYKEKLLLNGEKTELIDSIQNTQTVMKDWLLKMVEKMS